LKEVGENLHKSSRFTFKKSLVVFTLLIAGTVIGLNYSQSIAETPHVYHKDIEIIPDPNDPTLFTFIGNACVDSKGEILDPKVMLYSDMEQKPLHLTHVFYSDECFGAVEKIRANDPDSIEAKLEAYGDYSIIKEIEIKIEDLKILQDQQQEELKEVSTSTFQANVNHQEYIDAMREKSDALWITQKQLQQETAKYYEILRYLHPSVEP